MVQLLSASFTAIAILVQLSQASYFDSTRLTVQRFVTEFDLGLGFDSDFGDQVTTCEPKNTVEIVCPGKAPCVVQMHQVFPNKTDVTLRFPYSVCSNGYSQIYYKPTAEPGSVIYPIIHSDCNQGTVVGCEETSLIDYKTIVDYDRVCSTHQKGPQITLVAEHHRRKKIPCECWKDDIEMSVSPWSKVPDNPTPNARK